MSAPIKRLSVVKGDHDFSLDGDLENPRRMVTQSKYFRSGDFVIALGEINRVNRWNDEEFDRLALFLQTAWNDAVKKQAIEKETEK